jgi:hypothetical protein
MGFMIKHVTPDMRESIVSGDGIWLGMITSNLRDPLRRIIPHCNHSIPVSLLSAIMDYIALPPSTPLSIGYAILHTLDDLDVTVGHCWRVSNILPSSPYHKYQPVCVFIYTLIGFLCFSYLQFLCSPLIEV